MLLTIIIILFILWILGFIPISGSFLPNINLITINHHAITLRETLLFIFIAWAIGLLPRPFQVVASVLLILWILSSLGIFAISGLANIIVLIIIISLVISIYF